MGIALIIGGLIGLLGETPLSYKCLSPLFILVGVGLILMQIGGTDYTPAPYPKGVPGTNPATWGNASTDAAESEALAVQMGRMKPSERHGLGPITYSRGTGIPPEEVVDAEIVEPKRLRG